MSDYRVVESTASGWTQAVRAQVIYRDDSGGFVSRAEYVAERDGDPTYGAGGYGTGGYGV